MEEEAAAVAAEEVLAAEAAALAADAVAALAEARAPAAPAPAALADPVPEDFAAVPDPVDFIADRILAFGAPDLAFIGHITVAAAAWAVCLE